MARPIAVEEALARILRAVARGPVEDVPLSEAAGRVLAEPITAREDLWPFARAAMDGIAVRAADVADAAPDRPVRLQVDAVVYAGESSAVETGTAHGTCIRVATGAPVPPVADAVIPHEKLTIDGEYATVTQPVLPGTNVFPAGEDVRAGERVFEPGAVLHGGQLGLLASMGFAHVAVIQRPMVSIMTCGDELIDPAEPLRPGMVRESNSHVLAARVRALGAQVVTLGNVRDIEDELGATIRRGLDANVLITSGGLSAGERDLVRPALRRAGVAFEFEGVAMKPGAPAAFGRTGTCLVFALPGTPSACRVVFEVLVVPALRGLLGYREAVPTPASARLTAPLRARPGRRRYLWGMAALGPEGLSVTPHLVQGTAALRAASDANALIVVDPDVADLASGARVPVVLPFPEYLPVAARRGPIAIGVAGPPNAGKTTVIERLIPALTSRGITVAVIKHHAHQQGIDVFGTDTARATEAGAVRTVLAGPGGTTIRIPAGGDPSLDEVLAQVGDVELVLVEGYGHAGIPRILVHRAAMTSDRNPPAGPVIAVVGDPSADGPWFAWNEIERLADLVAGLAHPGRG